MGKKKTIEEVREIYKKYGYTLITEIYERNSQRLESICPNGHTCHITLRNFGTGNRCLPCQGIQVYTLESVKQLAQKDGYTIIDTVYISINKPLTFICPSGHKYSTVFANFKAGHRCPECSGVRRKNHEEIQKIVEAAGYKKLDKTVKSRYKMLVECPNGHQYKVNINSFVTIGVRCQECAGLKKKTIEEVRKIFEKEGYFLLDTVYIKAKSKLNVLCPKGHKYSVNLDNFRQGKRCSRCQIHFNELLTRKIFNTLFDREFVKCRPDFLLNPQTGCRLELDGYDAELKLAFEYDGEQHYSPIFGEKSFETVKRNDALKDELCKKEGIVLIRIPYTIKNKEKYIKKELTKRGISWLVCRS